MRKYIMRVHEGSTPAKGCSTVPWRAQKVEETNSRYYHGKKTEDE